MLQIDCFWKSVFRCSVLHGHRHFVCLVLSSSNSFKHGTIESSRVALAYTTNLSLTLSYLIELRGSPTQCCSWFVLTSIQAVIVHWNMCGIVGPHKSSYRRKLTSTYCWSILILFRSRKILLEFLSVGCLLAYQRQRSIPVQFICCQGGIRKR